MIDHDESFLPLLTVWIGVVFFLGALYSRRQHGIGFLVSAYIASLFVNHWLAAMVHSIPWKPFYDSTNTLVGFKEVTWGLVALACGTCIGTLIGAERRTAETERLDWARFGREANRLARFYAFLGVLFWAAGLTALASLPSVGNLISAGKQTVVFAICLKCWLAWRAGNTQSFIAWLALSMVFPIFTMLTQGFLSYGIAVVLTILSFVASFYRPRWRIALGGVVAIYCGLSLWVGYGQHRNEIRDAVWGEEGIETRISAVATMFASMEPFDFTDPEHLRWVDWRLNQNELVGAAVAYTPDRQPFAEGETFSSAVTSLIPRVIWPSKPRTGGSGDWVSRHTGILFGPGTSVGMGQTLEFYINFGSPGVLFGFFLFGGMLSLMDGWFARSLYRGDLKRALFWFMVGTGALQAGGALSEVTGTMAAGCAIALASNHVRRNKGDLGGSKGGVLADRARTRSR